MSRTVASIALACALVGLGASGTAAYVHYQHIADPSYISFCDVNASVSCTQVYASQYGTFAGVSVAVFGVIWFAFATLLALAAILGSPAVRESAPAYLFAASTIGLAVVLYLGYASLVILGLVCILCVVTYAAVIALFLISGAATSVPMMTVPGRAVSDLKALRRSPLAMALAALFVAGTASALAFFPRETPAAVAGGAAGGATRQRWQRSAGPRQRRSRSSLAPGRVRALLQLPAARDAWSCPAEGAKVLVVKFNDYQCPPCRQSFMDYKSVFAKYEASNPGAVRFVTPDFPLEAECNSGGAAPGGVRGCSRRAARPRKREASEMEEWLFANQPAMTPKRSAKAARDIGTGDQLRRALSGDARAGEGRHGVRPSARRRFDADLLHQRRQDRWHAAGGLLRSGDCV